MLMVGQKGWKTVPLELAEHTMIAAGCLGNGRYTSSQMLPSLSLVKTLSVYKLNCCLYRAGHLSQATLQALRLGQVMEQAAHLAPVTADTQDVLRFGKCFSSKHEKIEICLQLAVAAP